MKKVVIAVDSFKGTMSSIEVCSRIETGFKAILPEIETVKVPIADGGEGTVDTFLTALGGEKIKVTVKDPLFRDVESFYGILPDQKTAVIEMAAASGLPLVEEEKNPRLTSTYGTGELMLDALQRGCNKLIIGIGGSATNDGGIGMAAALGVKFLDQEGNPIALNGEGLGQLRRIDVSEKDPRIDRCQVLVACDVDNPLYGEHGAAYVFAPQKGADQAMVEDLDQNLQNYAAVLQKDLGLSVQEIAGAGAAGGLGAGLVAFTPAQLKPGIEIILDAVSFSAIIADADLIITGEGKIDGQSLRGKVPIGIADRAKNSGVPVIAIVGDVGDGLEAIYQRGISAIFSTNRVAVPFSEARLRAHKDLVETSEAIARLFKIAGW
ncbi:MAG TPA: glycerate kinase [Firmicutes bacterium]|jgi:glycerate kinase|nr:glycerate kinase [Bacillota bacterium]HBR34235.1 glycerate kinase [Bacillota bacterium]